MASIETRRNAAGAVTSYRVVWRDGGGRRSQALPTLEQAQQWKAVLEAAGHDTVRATEALLSRGTTTPPLTEVAAQHLDTLTAVQPYTRRKYEGYLRLHLAELAPRPVATITEADVAAWIRRMQEKGSSPKTIRNSHSFLSAVMATAVRRGWREDSPCNSRMLPRDDHTRDRATFLTLAQFAAIEEHLPPEERPLFRFMLETGLRLSEATALYPEDVDLDGPVPLARVNRAWKQGSHGGEGGWFLGPPKSRRSRRTVSLAPTTVDGVRPLVEAAEPGTLVFVTGHGHGHTPKHRTREKKWRRAIARAHAAGTLPTTCRPRIHDLRHSHASLMLAAGMPLHELSARLGHASITTTVDVYGHLVPDAHARGAALAANVFGS